MNHCNWKEQHRSNLNASCHHKYYIYKIKSHVWKSKMCLHLHTTVGFYVVQSHRSLCDAPEWVCWGDCVLFQWHTDWVIYVLLSARQRLLLGKSRRRATASLFSPDPMMSGLSAPSLKLGARHPSCWSKSHRDPIGCEPQLDLDWPVVSTDLMCIRTEDGNSSTYPLLLMLLLSWCRILEHRRVRISFVAAVFFTWVV